MSVLKRLPLILSLNIEYLTSGENVKSDIPSLHAVSVVHPRGGPVILSREAVLAKHKAC